MVVLCKLTNGCDVDVQVVRGTPAAPPAQLLRATGPALRGAAGLGAWELAARPPAGSPPPVGRLLLVDSLGSAPSSGYREPTVLLLDRVGGEEDVPQVLHLPNAQQLRPLPNDKCSSVCSTIISAHISATAYIFARATQQNKLLSAQVLCRGAWR